MATMNIPSLSVDTGAPRNVLGHTISGALVAGLTASALNYNKYKKGEMGKTQAINDSLKLSAQGGIATGSAIAAANYIGDSKYMSMFTAISVGIAGVYGVEKLTEILAQKAMQKAKQEAQEEIQSEEE